MNNIIERTWRQGELGQVDNLTGTAFSAEEKAHTFRIRGEDTEGIALALSGTVSATFMRSDKTDVTVSGSASGGVVTLTLSDACYAVKGKFMLTIFLTSGGQKTAIYAAVGFMA